MDRDHKKYIQTAVKYMKRCSTSLTKEMQIKARQRSHLSPVDLGGESITYGQWVHPSSM